MRMRIDRITKVVVETRSVAKRRRGKPNEKNMNRSNTRNRKGKGNTLE